MGCCCSQDEDATIDDEPGETTPFLPEGSHAQRSQSFSQNNSTPSLQPHSTHQTTLNNILDDVANRLIDISIADGVLLDQQDQRQRAKTYSVKLHQISPTLLQSASGQHVFSVPGVVAPQAILGAPPCNHADIVQVCAAADRFSAAVHSMKVTGSKGHLVVPLIPNQ